MKSINWVKRKKQLSVQGPHESIYFSNGASYVRLKILNINEGHYEDTHK